ncbi:MAG: transporter substrate-binding domain-containing protein [Treponema sp.]|nr:transporter substrate-binding domain-containing protein [Candidatus Treponema equifaecale]
MKKIVAGLLGLGMIVAFSGCNKKVEAGEFTIEKGVLKVGMEIGYPPMEYFAEDGKTPIGFDVELGKAVSEKLGLKVEFIDTAWDGIFAGLETNKYDCVMSAATITPERLESMEFTKPYIGNGQAIIITKNSKVSPKSPEELEGLSVGVQGETTSDYFMQKNVLAKGIKANVLRFDKVMNAYEDLRLDRCDTVVSDALVSAAYLGEGSPFVSVWQGEPDEFFGVAIRKGNSALTEKINQALDEMKADGTLKAISEKIFGADLTN